MYKLTVIIAFMFINFAWTYDFSDPDFNKVLMDDLLEYDNLAEYEQLPEIINQERSKRSATEENSGKCRKNKHNRCCNDDFKEPTETQEFKKSCFSEYRKAKRDQKNETENEIDIFNCEKVEKAKSKAICASECVAKKQGWLNDENQLDAAKIKAYLKNIYSDKTWQVKVIDEIVDTCIAEAAFKVAKNNERNNTDGSEQKCNPNPSKFSHCLWRQLILQCPKDMQDDSQQCQRIRDKATMKNNKYKDAKEAATN